MPRTTSLRPVLDALVAHTDREARLATDPLRFVRRYPDPADAEVAAFFASGLAYGRVNAFAPVLEALLAEADAHGGPRAWVAGWNHHRARALEPLYHRWTRGRDLALLAATLGAALADHSRLGILFEAGHAPDHDDIGPALNHGVSALRAYAERQTGHPFARLPLGFRYLLPRPADGSACKRMCMLLRWMARPPGSGADGLDLGLWKIRPAALVIPLDTHVQRLAWFMGLTRRKDTSWRTALEVTRALRRLAPADPCRYDFALAHLGISGRCRGRRVASICDACALVDRCRVGRPRAPRRAGNG